MQNQATFGYKSKLFQPTELGVYVIIGDDHGGGKSRYLMRVNYLPASHRREMNQTDAGTRTIQFAEVSRKKDAHPCTSTRIVPTVINANTISLSYSNDSTNVASTTTIEVPVTIDLK